MSSEFGHILQRKATDGSVLVTAAVQLLANAASTWVPQLVSWATHLQLPCATTSDSGDAHLLLADFPHADHGVLAAGTQDDTVRVKRRGRDPAVHVWVRDLLSQQR